MPIRKAKKRVIFVQMKKTFCEELCCEADVMIRVLIQGRRCSSPEPRRLEKEANLTSLTKDAAVVYHHYV